MDYTATGDFAVVSWGTPSASFTRMTLEQCVDNGGSCVEPHVVTALNSLNVSVSDGTEMELIVWQDHDPVLRHRFSLKPDDKSSESGKK